MEDIVSLYIGVWWRSCLIRHRSLVKDISHYTKEFGGGIYLNTHRILLGDLSEYTM